MVQGKFRSKNVQKLILIKLYQLSTEINSIAKSHLTNRHVYRTAPYPEHQLLAYYTNYLAKEVQTLFPTGPGMPPQQAIPIQKAETPITESRTTVPSIVVEESR